MILLGEGLKKEVLERKKRETSYLLLSVEPAWTSYVSRLAGKHDDCCEKPSAIKHVVLPVRRRV